MVGRCRRSLNRQHVPCELNAGREQPGFWQRHSAVLLTIVQGCGASTPVAPEPTEEAKVVKFHEQPAAPKGAKPAHKQRGERAARGPTPLPKKEAGNTDSDSETEESSAAAAPPELGERDFEVSCQLAQSCRWLGLPGSAVEARTPFCAVLGPDSDAAAFQGAALFAMMTGGTLVFEAASVQLPASVEEPAAAAETAVARDAEEESTTLDESAQGEEAAPQQEAHVEMAEQAQLDEEPAQEAALQVEEQPGASEAAGEEPGAEVQLCPAE
jgi:hypothetical protein